MRAAWRENLLAVRSFIDYWAEKLNDDADQNKDQPNGGRENIPMPPRTTAPNSVFAFGRSFAR